MTRAIEFGNPDRVPLITWRAVGFDEWLRYEGHDSFRSEIERILKRYPSDAFYVDTPWIGQGRVGTSVGSRDRDEWGVVWTTLRVGCMDTEHPLADWRSLDTYRFPDPSFYVPDGAEAAADRQRADRYVHVGTFGSYFQLMTSLRGFDNLMLDLATGPKELVVLANRLVEYFVDLIDRWSGIGVDGMFFADDWGTQHGLMIRPALWREFFKPRYREMFEAVHRAGSHVWFHSDGFILDIIPDLVEIGVDVLNVNQLSLNGLHGLGHRFGGKVCFLGGLDQQRILPFGTVKEVERHVKQIIESLATYGGGYVAVALSGGGADIPFSNLMSVLDAFIAYGSYPITTASPESRHLPGTHP